MNRIKRLLSPGDYKKYFIQDEYKVVVKGGLKAEKNSAKKPRMFKGYAGTIGKDRVRDNIVIAAWKKSKDDLLQEGAKTVFFNHNTDKPIGFVKSTTVDDKGLLVTVQVSKSKDVDSVWEKIQEGTLNALSIRLRPKKVETVEDQDSGRIIEYRIKEMELLEVSVVGLPANPRASITEVSKSLKDAKNRYNKRSRKNMKTKKAKTVKRPASKKSRQKAVSNVSADVLKSQIEGLEVIKNLQQTQQQTTEALATIAESIKALASKAMTEEEKKAEAARKAQEEAEKMQRENPVAAAMLAAVQEMKNLVVTRKGMQGDEGDGDGFEVPKKLKSADDPDTLKFVFHVMGDGDKQKMNEEAWIKLSDAEKQRCKDLYAQAFFVANTH